MASSARQRSGLSALAVKAAKGRDKQYKLADSGGLYLLVKPSGQRYWRMNYRYLGAFKTLAFGVWPDVDLAIARAKRDQARKLLAKGIDPGAQARLDRIAASIATANTFGAVADEWVDKIAKDGLAEVTLKKIRWLLTQITPAIGTRPIAEISAPELLMALRKVEAMGRYDTAQRLRSTCGQIFRYAIATARAERDISNDLRGALIAHRVTHRAAILKPTEAGALLRAIETFEGHDLTKTALRLLPHVFVRPGELRHAEWGEFDLDRGGLDYPRSQDQDAPRSRCPPVSSSLGNHRRDGDGRDIQHIPLSVPAFRQTPHVGKYNQRRASPPRLCQGRNDRPRFPRDGLHAAQRNGNMESRRHRKAIGPCRRQLGSAGLHARRILGRASAHDATLVRLSGSTARGCGNYSPQFRKPILMNAFAVPAR